MGLFGFFNKKQSEEDRRSRSCRETQKYLQDKRECDTRKAFELWSDTRNSKKEELLLNEFHLLKCKHQLFESYKKIDPIGLLRFDLDVTFKAELLDCAKINFDTNILSNIAELFPIEIDEYNFNLKPDAYLLYLNNKMLSELAGTTQLAAWQAYLDEGTPAAFAI